MELIDDVATKREWPFQHHFYKNDGTEKHFSEANQQLSFKYFAILLDF